MKRTMLVLLAAGCFAAGEAGAVAKITPVASVNLLGGQYWMTGSQPDQAGPNLDVFISPVVNFSPRLALLPIYTGVYSTTKDVRDVVGGGTLTQETQSHALSLKLVNRFSDAWKLKVRAGYKMEYLNETADESWGEGLFDYRKIIFGAEGERLGKRTNLRFGADYYTMRYPNYRSLVTEDRFETSIDTTTYSEISSQAGTNVLDHTAVALFAEAARALAPALTGTLHYDIALKSFDDQRVVGESGEFSSTLRTDVAHALTLGISLETPRAVLSISDAVQLCDSNQNSWDAANLWYYADYYDFVQNGIRPAVTFSLGSLQSPKKLSLFWDLAWRRYPARPAKDAQGDDLDEKVVQLFNTVGASFAYPLANSFSLMASLNYRDASSNMRYEKNYKYNYYTFNYFLGIGWEL